MNEKLVEILERFKHFESVYEKDMVNAAIELKEEITPYLIAVLENLLANPNEYLENPDRFDHIYTVMLLSHFREAVAHKILIDVFSLPDRLSNNLFGDIVTEDLPMILLRTSNGSLEHIKAMALNKNVNDYCRYSALRAMAYATFEGIAIREDVLAFYGTLFSGQEADIKSDLWSLLASLVYDFYPEELIDTISRAYKDGLIYPGMIDYPSFELALSRDKEEHLEKFRKDFKRRSLDNIHDCMSWWHCFNPESKRLSPEIESLFPTDYPAEVPHAEVPHAKFSMGQLTMNTKKQKRDKKKKRKMSKVSKRKNRR